MLLAVPEVRVCPFYTPCASARQMAENGLCASWRLSLPAFPLRCFCPDCARCAGRARAASASADEGDDDDRDEAGAAAPLNDAAAQSAAALLLLGGAAAAHVGAPPPQAQGGAAHDGAPDAGPPLPLQGAAADVAPQLQHLPLANAAGAGMQPFQLLIPLPPVLRLPVPYLSLGPRSPCTICRAPM